MKRFLRPVLSAALCAAAITAGAQQKGTSLGIFANAGGFALMGPAIGAEVTLGERFIIEGFYRAPALGALTTSVTDFSRAVEGSTEVDKGSGIGGAVKLYFPQGNGGWYAGVFVDYMYLMYKYMYVDDWESGGRSPRWAEMSGVGFGANAGYKYTFASGFYLRGGAYLGGMSMGKTTYYDGADDTVGTEEGSFYPYLNLDISVGFSF